MRKKILSAGVLGCVVALGASALPAVAVTPISVDVTEGFLKAFESRDGVDYIAEIPIRFACDESMWFRIDLTLSQDGVSRKGSSIYTCSGVDEVMPFGFGNSDHSEFHAGVAKISLTFATLKDDRVHQSVSLHKEITLVDAGQA